VHELPLLACWSCSVDGPAPGVDTGTAGGKGQVVLVPLGFNWLLGIAEGLAFCCWMWGFDSSCMYRFTHLRYNQFDTAMTACHWPMGQWLNFCPREVISWILTAICSPWTCMEWRVPHHAKKTKKV
jgi:hypothetical protein